MPRFYDAHLLNSGKSAILGWIFEQLNYSLDISGLNATIVPGK